jgi:ABC-type branched-subunit amino acid transport system substrate-binding protein
MSRSDSTASCPAVAQGGVSKVPYRRRPSLVLVLVLAVAAVAAVCGGSSSAIAMSTPKTATSANVATPTTSATELNTTSTVPTCPSGVAQGSPGVTSKNINLAAIATESGPLAGDFSSMIPGVKAYFSYINAMGGVNGRKFTLANNIDDQGNPSQYSQAVQTAIEQDHAFALVGVASPFFAPNLVAQTCTPTYGYNVTHNWAGPPNLYSTGGSALYYPSIGYYIAYLMKRLKVHSFATLAYNVAASSDACNAANTSLTKAGFKQAYTDLGVPLGGNLNPDVQHIKSSGAQLVVTCMSVTDNVSLARGIKQYGVKTKQYWLNGEDPSTLANYGSLVQGVYFGTQHVPFTAPLQYYPAMKTYLNAMKKYQPKYAQDELAIQGWASAALFVQGVKNAGSNVTQANVVKQDNLLTQWTANGLYYPINWGTAHTKSTNFCEALIQAKGTKYVPVFNSGHQVFNCFAINPANPVPKNPTPIASPAGTPGT